MGKKNCGCGKDPCETYGKQEDVKEDWQKANRKDKTDGMSQKAVNAYRRENPGSKLKTAVTEKNPGGREQRDVNLSVPDLMVRERCTTSIVLRPQRRKSVKHVSVGGAD